jgi:hypothetical protein
MAKQRARRRGGNGLHLVLFTLLAIAVITTIKASREKTADAAKEVAELMAKGAVAATAAAFAARFLLLRLGLVFLAPWVAGAVAVAAFAAVGAWKLSADELGLPGGSGGQGNSDDCDGQLKYFDPDAGVWRCSHAAG